MKVKNVALRNHNRTVFEQMTSWTTLIMHLRDEDSILDQTYQNKICSDFYYDDF